MLLASRAGARTDSVPVDLDKFRYLLPLVALLIAVFHGAFPTYYLLGGRDPGLYLLYAVVIGKTGTLELATTSSLVVGTGLEGLVHPIYPGLYDPVHRGFDSDPGLFLAQFHHAFSAFAAIFYELWGIEGVVRTNAFIAFFGLWSFGEVLRRLVGVRLALLGVALLGLNVAFAWNARITLTEMMSLAGVFAGMALLLRSFDSRQQISTAMLSGLLLSISVFTRMDGVLVSGLLVGLVLLVPKHGERNRKQITVTCIVYGFFSVLALADAITHSPAYYQDLWRQGSSKYLVFGHLAMLTLLGFLLVARRFQWWDRIDRLFDRLWPTFTKLVAIAFLILFFFLYLFYPQMGSGGFEYRAFNELAWYVSVFLYLAAVGGLWLSAGNERVRVLSILLMFFLAILVLFTVEPAISPDHIWASRRWVPLVIPGLVLSAMVCLKLLSHKIRTAVAFVLVGGYAATLFPYAKVFYTDSMLRGYRDGYEAVVEDLRSLPASDSAIFLTTNGWTASILRFVYDLPVALINSGVQARLVNFGLESERVVYLLEHEAEREESTALAGGKVCGKFLEKVRGARPSHLFDWCNGVYAFDVKSAESLPTPISLQLANGLFHTKIGIRTEKGFATDGKEGWLVYGPYGFLQPGTYTITWSGDFRCQSPPLFQVAAESGRHVLVSSRDERATKCQDEGDVSHLMLTFVSETALDGVEYRVHVQPEHVARVERVDIEKHKDGVQQ